MSAFDRNTGMSWSPPLPICPADLREGDLVTVLPEGIDPGLRMQIHGEERAVHVEDDGLRRDLGRSLSRARGSAEDLQADFPIAN